MQGFINVAEAANRLGVTVQMVRKLITAGRLQGEQVSPRCWLVSVASIDARLANPPPSGNPKWVKKGGQGDVNP